MDSPAKAIPAAQLDEVGEIERLSRAISSTTVQALDKVQATTSPTQVRALLVIEESGGCSNTELATTLAIFPSSASRLIDRLIAAGLVVREQGVSDKREVRLVLTPAGRRSVDRFVQARSALLADVTALMRPADRAALIRGLAAFCAAADRQSRTSR